MVEYKTSYGFYIYLKHTQKYSFKWGIWIFRLIYRFRVVIFRIFCVHCHQSKHENNAKSLLCTSRAYEHIFFHSYLGLEGINRGIMKWWLIKTLRLNRYMFPCNCELVAKICILGQQHKTRRVVKWVQIDHLALAPWETKKCLGMYLLILLTEL